MCSSSRKKVIISLRYTKNIFKNIQKGKSSRSISIIGKDLYINIYSGIFRNENIILPEISA
jgi:hypothetical protein